MLIGCGGGGGSVPGIPSQPTMVPTNVGFPTPSGDDKAIYNVINGNPNNWISVTALNSSGIEGSQSNPIWFQLGNNGAGYTEVYKNIPYQSEMHENQGDGISLKTSIFTITGSSFQDDFTNIPDPTPTPVATATPTATPIPGQNTAPSTPTNLLPTNGTTGVSINATLGAKFEDANGGSGLISFYKENGELIGTASNIASGNMGTIMWNGLDPNTTYGFYAIASDGSLTSNRSNTNFFTTEIPNTAPNAPSALDPNDGSTDVSTDVTISAYYSDPEGDIGSLIFKDASDNSTIGTATNVASGTRGSANWNGLDPNSSYGFYIVANDGEFNSPNSVTTTFTTAPLSDPTPEVTLIAPRGGEVGDEITITGSNLANCTVTIRGIDQASGMITKTNSLISFNIVSGTYLFNNGITTIKVENTGGSVEMEFVCYNPRDDMSIGTSGVAPDTKNWGLVDLSFNTTGTCFYGVDYAFNVVRKILFPSYTEDKTSAMLPGAASYINYNKNNDKIYIDQGSEAAFLNNDLSTITYFGAGIFANQSAGTTSNSQNPSKTYFLDDNTTTNYIRTFDTDGSNPDYTLISYRPFDLISDLLGNLYYSSSSSDKIVKHNSTITATQDYARYMTSIFHNGKTYLVSTGKTGSTPIISIFLVENDKITRLIDISFPDGWGIEGLDFSNGYLVICISNPKRIEVIAL